MASVFRALLAATFFLLLDGGASAQTRFGAQGQPDGALRQQTWLIPLPHAGDAPMHATVFRPPGEDRRPLVVINHGSPAKPADRPKMKPVFKAASEWFVQRGFVVVLPVRRGYGATGGNWAETYGKCANPDFRRAGDESAKDIQAAIDFMLRQSFVDGERAIVVGQSAGGWGSIALASQNPRNVSAIVNFAGGRGGYADGKPNNNCAPDRLVAAAGEFGKTARIPMLWIYTENDLFFSPAISQGMANAFTGAGGKAEYVLLPAFAKDGHTLFGSSAGVRRWRPVVEKFLGANGR